MFAARNTKQHRDRENAGRSHNVTGAAKTPETLPPAPQTLQRAVGNQAMQAMGDKKQDSKQQDLPRIRLTNFSADAATGQMNSTGSFQPRLPDKSTSQTTGEQDQNATLTSFATESRGVGIVVEITNGASSPDYPNGYHWTQTIDTNVPLGGTTSPYVDPRPNDDTKPFYWTDAEAAARPTTFIDHPSRHAPASGTTTWDAVLSVNGVNGTTVTRLDSLAYGFSIDTAGTVSPRTPTSPGSGLVTTHQMTLASEFPGWTFN
ncbi:MAG: hypothetical protein HY885_16500 [Deltaproteobacteria bacterium]|nr:hypothetical protein [Deltaproteobacteria bacterium]